MKLNFKKLIVHIVPIVTVAMLYMIKVSYGSYINGRFMPCWFNFATGYLCAGCGGTRSFFALMSGDVLSSLKYNAFVPFMAILAIVFYVRWYLKIVLEKPITVFPKDDRWIYIPLAVFLMYFILRNFFV
jgi:hypothetical protein